MNKEIIKAVIEGKIDKSFLKIIDIEKPIFIRYIDEPYKTSSKKGTFYYTENQLSAFTDTITKDNYIIIDIGVDE